MTLTIQGRESILGSLVGNKVELSEFGKIVREEWLCTPTIRPEVMLDEFVIMPDHLHGIIVICEERNGVHCRAEWQFAPTRSLKDRVAPFRSPSRTVGAIIRGFKGASTKRINEERGTPRAQIWQRNFYDHIICDAQELSRIREYIRNNPRKWSSDNENPIIIH